MKVNNEASTKFTKVGLKSSVEIIFLKSTHISIKPIIAIFRAITKSEPNSRFARASFKKLKFPFIKKSAPNNIINMERDIFIINLLLILLSLFILLKVTRRTAIINIVVITLKLSINKGNISGINEKSNIAFKILNADFKSVALKNTQAIFTKLNVISIDKYLFTCIFLSINI